MASECWNEDKRVLRLESENPHFFKIILPPTLHRGKLEIPKKFVRKYGKYLSQVLSLKVPTGDTWQVDLEKSSEHEHTVWLNRGWNDFVEYYSIREDYFIVFGHEGNSIFSVMIFDTSATEIDYPKKDDGVSRRIVDRDGKLLSSMIKKEDNDVDQGIEIIDLTTWEMEADEVGSSRKQSKNEAPKMAKPDICMEDPHEVKRLEAPSSGGIKMTARPKRKIHPACPTQNFVGKSAQISTTTRNVRRTADHPSSESSPNVRALEAASNFKSSYRFFKIVFSSDSMKYYAHLPNSSMKKMGVKSTQLVTLRFLSSSWRVKLWSYQQRYRFTTGWSEFGKQVPLHDGDVCIFERVDEKKVVFKVSIFRGNALIQ